MKVKQLPLPLTVLSTLLFVATNAHAFKMSNLLNGIIVDEIMMSRHLEEADSDEDDDLRHSHVSDAVIITIAAWLVAVVTLEVNDFRHRLMATYNDSTSDEKTSRRYAAALLAIQYGMYDAFIDWGLTYTICYAIVGGITWHNADANMVLVIWGFSLMCSALILAVAGLKIPAWLGHYRKSQLKTIRDTSGFAYQAVDDLIDRDSTISAFRYQVRLGVGKHFTQFVWFLLPFYVNLKFWFYLLSGFIGLVLGQLFLYVVFNCRKRFRNSRGRVAMGACAFVSICSSLCFMFGVWIVQASWGIEIGQENILLPVAFFVWLAFCGLFQGVKYYEHRKLSMEEIDDAQLFEDTVRDEAQDGGADAEEPKSTTVEDDENVDVMPNDTQQSSINSTNRRKAMDKDTENTTGHGYFYKTAYFDRVNKKPSLAAPPGDNNNNIKTSEVLPRDVYKSIAEAEDLDAGVKWYNRLWRVLPFTSYWGLFLAGVRDMNCCCRGNKDENRRTHSGFQSMSTCQKSWFIFAKIIKLAVNAAAIFVAVFSMGAAVQATVSKSKTPFVHARYRTLNTGPVCAYDTKCGDIQTFENKEAADAANYTIVHCGFCSGCSSWQDLSVQWNTRKEAAKLSQGCGLQNMFNRDNMARCMSERMGWTTECSYAWVASVECAKQNCMFIAVTAMITNKLGNFAVGPDLVTPAMCNEAQCEQGNPGEFAKLSGASRRKMNIASDIVRPKDQQCGIVGAVPLDDNGFNDWTGFFEPLCPRDASPP